MCGARIRRAPGRPRRLAPSGFRSREEMDFSSRHLLLSAADRAQHPRVREAAAKDARHSFLDFFFRGLWILIEKNLGRENDAAQAITTLRGLLIDERLLNGVRFLGGAQAFDSDDLGALHRSHFSSTGANRLSLNHYRAGSALSEAAAEFRAAQAEVVAQHVEQRSCRIDI